jgi:DNA (cytosine-5)-methyltransferase 1
MGMLISGREKEPTFSSGPAATVLPRMRQKLKFVDLFAGLGGFHQALSALGHQCVFASEIDPTLQDLYEANFGLRPAGDIRTSHHLVPAHDILCAGFPCQPFSKAGEQLGFDCPQWGDLFDFVIQILETHRPGFLLIENVPNLMRHRDGKTWARIQKRLKDAGYDVRSRKLSPHLFGVAQRRERAIIVGRYKSLGDFEWPATCEPPELSMSDILDKKPADARRLPPQYLEYLRTWQEFLDLLPKGTALSAFPIWAMEFGADYPIDGKVPLARPPTSLTRFKGSFGQPLDGRRRAVIRDILPPYARSAEGTFPAWKQEFIASNREFYLRHKAAIDPWLPSVRRFPASFQKLEWNWRDGDRKIDKGLVQFRASGIRVRNPSSAPSLVALTASQVPVVAWEGRYMTARECARLQSMSDSFSLPATENAAFRALGNAVNVRVIQEVGRSLLTLSLPVVG